MRSGRWIGPQYVAAALLLLAGALAAARPFVKRGHAIAPPPTASAPEAPAAVIVTEATESTQATHCGSAGHEPDGAALRAFWAEYRCMSEEQAGAVWPACLLRAQYSELPGAGCDGDELCCPPADAKSSTGTAGRWTGVGAFEEQDGAATWSFRIYRKADGWRGTVAIDRPQGRTRLVVAGEETSGQLVVRNQGIALGDTSTHVAPGETVFTLAKKDDGVAIRFGALRPASGAREGRVSFAQP